MMEFNDDDFEIELPSVHHGLYEGMEMQTYREADGLANSELQLFDKNPASYMWNKQAPTDVIKVTSADFGTALHTSLLEPELFDDSVLVSDTKGRTAEAFHKMQMAHKDKIILTETEYNKIKIMTESAKCDPMFNHALQSKGICEASIFVTDPTTGVAMKIRPDKVIMNDQVMLADVKSSADLDEWRQDKQWLNPLFKFGYGFTAAYYLHAGSIHFNQELTKYTFLVVSKSARMGKYPVSVFIITKDELIEYGFWQQMLDALSEFAKREKSGNFMSYEKFPEFHIYNEESVEVTFED